MSRVLQIVRVLVDSELSKKPGPEEFDSLEAAEKYILNNTYNLPGGDDVGYCKNHVQIKWEDGKHFVARIDTKKHGNHPSPISNHLRNLVNHKDELPKVKELYLDHEGFEDAV